MDDDDTFYLQVKKLVASWREKERESVERGMGPRSVQLSWICGNLEVFLAGEAKRRGDG